MKKELNNNSDDYQVINYSNEDEKGNLIKQHTEINQNINQNIDNSNYLYTDVRNLIRSKNGSISDKLIYNEENKNHSKEYLHSGKKKEDIPIFEDNQKKGEHHKYIHSENNSKIDNILIKNEVKSGEHSKYIHSNDDDKPQVIKNDTKSGKKDYIYLNKEKIESIIFEDMKKDEHENLIHSNYGNENDNQVIMLEEKKKTSVKVAEHSQEKSKDEYVPKYASKSEEDEIFENNLPELSKKQHINDGSISPFSDISDIDDFFAKRKPKVTSQAAKRQEQAAKLRRNDATKKREQSASITNKDTFVNKNEKVAENREDYDRPKKREQVAENRDVYDRPKKRKQVVESREDYISKNRTQNYNKKPNTQNTSNKKKKRLKDSVYNQQLNQIKKRKSKANVEKESREETEWKISYSIGSLITMIIVTFLMLASYIKGESIQQYIALMFSAEFGQELHMILKGYKTQNRIFACAISGAVVLGSVIYYLVAV